ncbi:hypothetical protein PR048_021901 [Dryococelus australis]|uniref:Uncharacterized protein n=1 Tax=Dryococelus australis TaxID=614101 RepID=A0ABQ9GZS2_9NEOP|nr:hypothetical protein PR048_021901 [Dryococelus australis]
MSEVAKRGMGREPAIEDPAVKTKKTQKTTGQANNCRRRLPHVPMRFSGDGLRTTEDGCHLLNLLRITMQHEPRIYQEPGKSPLSSPASGDHTESPGIKKREHQRGNRSNRNHTSPQQTNASSTPNKWSRQGGQYKPSSISLGDFIGSDQKQGKANRSRNKQVTPTKISGECVTSPSKVESRVNCSPKLVSRSSPGSPEHVLHGAELISIQLDPSKVTHSEKVLLLCNLYNFLLDHNLVTNIVKELTFCLALLLVRTRCDDECVRKKLASKVIDSVENCVFFSATMLHHQKMFLSMLDRSTLVMLAENVRVAAYVPDLCTYLLSRDEMSAVWVSPYMSSYVMYQDDTDTRAHFQSEYTFNAFRKHRDQFYEILSLWKKNHSQLGWCFNAELGASVKALLGSCNNPLNLFHFARLFRSQLQLSCINSRNDVPNQQPSSYCKRLETYEVQSTVPFSRHNFFSGPEEFFRDFILLATTASSGFTQHLIDSMIHELVSLNDTAFTATDMGGRDTVGEETREHFKLCVAQMMLLGKFIGFMVYLPYYSSEEIAESILEPHVRLRKLSMPPIDILKFLTEALEAQKLVVTVPWVVAYLRMLDQVSFRLPYYLTVFDKLFDIYYNWTRLARPTFPALSVVFVTVILGSLFEEPGFPCSIYFTWKFGLPTHMKSLCQPMQMDGAADLLNVVDKQALFLCCPALWQFHSLLATAHRDPAFLCSVGVEKQALPPPAGCILEQPSDPGSKGHEVCSALWHCSLSICMNYTTYRQSITTPLKMVERRQASEAIYQAYEGNSPTPLAPDRHHKGHVMPPTPTQRAPVHEPHIRQCAVEVWNYRSFADDPVSPSTIQEKDEPSRTDEVGVPEEPCLRRQPRLRPPRRAWLPTKPNMPDGSEAATTPPSARKDEPSRAEGAGEAEESLPLTVTPTPPLPEEGTASCASVPGGTELATAEDDPDGPRNRPTTSRKREMPTCT